MSRVVLGNGVLGTSPLRLRYLFLFAIICGTTLIILSYNGFTNEPYNFDIMVSQSYYDADQERFTIRTSGCTIAALLPHDPSIKQFVGYPNSVKPCRNEKTPLLDSNYTHIWINKKNARHYNVTGRKTIRCCYRSFFRPLLVNDVSSSNIDNRVEYRKCKKFTDVIEAHDEFVNVLCYGGLRLVYEQYFLFAVDKELPNKKADATQNNSTYNVIVMGIDAVSRLNFYRTMPKTLNFLKEKNAIELRGYNKVGDNTFPNLIPMLMGIRETELKRTCVPNSKLTYFDNCPFVWEWFKQAGFFTALGEDSSNLGTFNYLKDGFTRSPTDYYIHTFINEAEKNVGNNKDLNSFLCMNNKYFFTVLLNYIEHLLIKLRSSKLFGFFWEITMSHDYLNYPMVMDLHYEYFFRQLDFFKVLNNTFIFLVSDHGIRWGDIRSTKQGRLEERLPFVHILVPPSFQETYSVAYTNLKLNSRRLTTPFNIHSTLNDLVDLKVIENLSIQLRSKDPYWDNRNISLFLPIPSNRTCSQADIDDHWCTCHHGRKIITQSSEATEAAAKIIEELNKLLIAYEMCAQLSLAEILDATEMEVGTKDKNEISWREFMIIIRTYPSNAVFEATIRHDGQTWTLIGTASRLNLYGDQSKCINDPHLKLYCYCV